MEDLLKIGFDIVGNGVVLAGLGLIVIVFASALIESWPVLIKCLIKSFFLALVLVPAIDVENPHGPTGFPALICLLGRGPNGPEDTVTFGILPLFVGWIVMFLILWHRLKKQQNHFTRRRDDALVSCRSSLTRRE
jgi:hypothetical protein